MEEQPLRTARDALFVLKNQVWSNKHDLSTSQRAVLEALIHFCDEGGETFVSIATTAARTHRSVGTVRRCLNALRSRGVITTAIENTSRGRRLRYTIRLAALGCTPAQNDRTHAIKVIRPPQASPSSDRVNFNDPPIAPLTGGARSDAEASSTKTKPADSHEDEAAITRVLQLFVAVLWPKASGPAVTRSRRRVVLGRLRELRQGPLGADAEQTLCDAVRGAAIHPWHREADQGRHARQVFRDLDKVEELAALGRAKRLADDREARRRAGDSTKIATHSSSAMKPPETAIACREGVRVLTSLLETWGESPSKNSPTTRTPALSVGELAALRAADECARSRVG
jgi:hypothetical protein